MSERVSIADLQPGMMILQVTAQNGPVKIRKSGLISSVDMIKGLAEMGVQEVEIDPELTVEVEAPEIVKSQTQQLLEREQHRDARVDQSMSEQFNRSLFLPSVQELPGFWHYYARQALAGVAVAILGGALGFGAATHTLWLSPGLLADNTEVATVQTGGTPATTPPSVPATLDIETTPAQSNPAPVQEVTSAPDVGQTSEVYTAQQNTQGEQDAGILAPEQELADYEREGRVLNDGSQPVDENAISPELLQRFEQAINDLDNAAQPSPEETEVLSMSASDVPKVHELPAYVLTQLPGMAFSAHMYASDADNRWVRVNGKRLGEGEWVEDGLRVVKIEPQQVILNFRGNEFSMAALTDW